MHQACVVAQFASCACSWVINQTSTSRSSDFVNQLYDSNPNWTPLSPFTITNCMRYFLIVALGFVTHFTFSSGFTHRINFFCCRRAFFHRWLEIVDLTVVVVSFILTLTFSLLTLEEHGYAKWVFWIRQEPSCFSREKEKIWWNWISKWSNHSKIICWM